MHELGEIGVLGSKFRRGKFASFADAIEYLGRNVNITQKHYFLKKCRLRQEKTKTRLCRLQDKTKGETLSNERRVPINFLQGSGL